MDVANGAAQAAAVAPASANGNGEAGAASDSGEFKLKFCTVCASNQNR